MGINEIIILIMVIFMVVGAVVCKCLGNKFGYGEKFEEGFMAMGALALAMVGVVSLAPVLANLFETNYISSISNARADPSMFATLLACDMGGYPLAIQLAQTPEAGNFAGLILGSMMGPTSIYYTSCSWNH